METVVYFRSMGGGDMRRRDYGFALALTAFVLGAVVLPPAVLFGGIWTLGATTALVLALMLTSEFLSGE
jgi:hypothetical protein